MCAEGVDICGVILSLCEFGCNIRVSSLDMESIGGGTYSKFKGEAKKF